MPLWCLRVITFRSICNVITKQWLEFIMRCLMFVNCIIGISTVFCWNRNKRYIDDVMILGIAQGRDCEQFNTPTNSILVWITNGNLLGGWSRTEAILDRDYISQKIEKHGHNNESEMMSTLWHISEYLTLISENEASHAIYKGVVFLSMRRHTSDILECKNCLYWCLCLRLVKILMLEDESKFSDGEFLTTSLSESITTCLCRRDLSAYTSLNLSISLCCFYFVLVLFHHIFLPILSI